MTRARTKVRRSRQAGDGGAPMAENDLRVEFAANTASEVSAAIASAPRRGIATRGQDGPIWDVNRNTGGATLALVGPLADIRRTAIDWERRIATVPGGVSVGDLIPHLLRHGWFLPSPPSRLDQTVGAAIAADERSQRPHAGAAFADHVEALELIDGCGERREITPQADPSAFWATVGGTGLTGVVTRAEIAIRPVTSAWLSADSTKCASLDDLIERMSDVRCGPDTQCFLAAKLDPTALGGQVGRGVITEAHPVPATELPTARQPDALAFDADPAVGVRPSGFARRIWHRGVSAAHKFAYHLAPSETQGGLLPACTLFRPRDPGPNECVITYEFAVPHDASRVIATALRLIAASGTPIVRARLRRADASGSALLTAVPSAGWIAELDLVPTASTGASLDLIDEAVAASGGAVRLASDRRMRPELVAIMYPGIDEWRDIREKLDPKRRLHSDLARRLGL